MDADGNRYGPYDVEVAGSQAEALTEEAWFDLFSHLSGVRTGGALTFTGLTATLAPIDMLARGSFLTRTDPWSDASPPTTGGSPRRDLLVARRQLTSGTGVGAVPGKTFLTVLRGTAATTPVDPAYDPDDDEPLWSWQVPGSGGTVVTQIRDLRRFLSPDDGRTYYDEGNGGGTIGTSATAPTDGASLSLPAGTYDVDFLMHYALSVSTARTFVLHLRLGTVDQFTPSFSVTDPAATTSRTFVAFKRITLATAGTVTVRASASATGGTQNMGTNFIRAHRVA